MPDSYVTQAEFSEFRKDTRTSLEGISAKLDVKTGTNWGVIWSASTVVAVFCIAIVSGAWVLINTQVGALKEIVQGSDMRIQRLENITDRERDAKAKMWDNFIFQKLTE